MKIFSKFIDLWHVRNSKSLICALRKKGVKIGEGCIIRYPHTARIDISRPALVTIGDNVDMNKNFQILTHDWSSHVFLGLYDEFINSSGAVTIGSNIYFGTDVIVLKGVTIGDNCIIGAGSIVTRDIPSNSVATGVPCNVVCSIDEYYSRRKKKGLAEAVEYAKAIQKRFGRDPLPCEMTEEFIYFVNKDNVERYELEGVPVKRQLGTAYSKWIVKHESEFSDFESFLRYVNSHSYETGGGIKRVA